MTQIVDWKENYFFFIINFMKKSKNIHYFLCQSVTAVRSSYWNGSSSFITQQKISSLADICQLQSISDL